MNSNRVLCFLLILNTGFFALQLMRAQSESALAAAPVVRCSALELVDEHGRVRAELKVFPSQPDLKMPDGSVGHPETVLLRLINSTGGPHVKLSASEDGAGLVLGGDGGHVQILSRESDPFIKVTDKAGRQQVIEP
jgi:hypothetical protein